MALSGQVFVDTNVPVYAAGRPSEYKAACVRIMQALTLQQLWGATSTEVLVELVLHYMHRRQERYARFVIDRFVGTLQMVHPIEWQDVDEMLILLQEHDGLTARDALHLATMRRHGISHIITADKHFRVVPDLVVLDPVEAAAALP